MIETCRDIRFCLNKDDATPIVQILIYLDACCVLLSVKVNVSEVFVKSSSYLELLGVSVVTNRCQPF